MDTIISGIIGEDDQERLEEPKINHEPASAPVAPVGPEDSEIDELASMWNSGNKLDVLQRFMEMDNKTAVKLVFSIGLEGSLALAEMADREIEEGEFPDEEGGEPIEPGEGQDSTIREIVGHNPEEGEEPVIA